MPGLGRVVSSEKVGRRRVTGEKVLSLEVRQWQVRSHISRMEVPGKRQNKRVSIFEKRGLRLREPVQSDQNDPKGGARTHRG